MLQEARPFTFTLLCPNLQGIAADSALVNECYCCEQCQVMHMDVKSIGYALPGWQVPTRSSRHCCWLEWTSLSASVPFQGQMQWLAGLTGLYVWCDPSQPVLW